MRHRRSLQTDTKTNQAIENCRHSEYSYILLCLFCYFTQSTGPVSHLKYPFDLFYFLIERSVASPVRESNISVQSSYYKLLWPSSPMRLLVHGSWLILCSLATSADRQITEYDWSQTLKLLSSCKTPTLLDAQRQARLKFMSTCHSCFDNRLNQNFYLHKLQRSCDGDIVLPVVGKSFVLQQSLMALHLNYRAFTFDSNWRGISFNDFVHCFRQFIYTAACSQSGTRIFLSYCDKNLVPIKNLFSNTKCSGLHPLLHMYIQLYLNSRSVKISSA